MTGFGTNKEQMKGVLHYAHDVQYTDQFKLEHLIKTALSVAVALAYKTQKAPRP